MHDCLRYLSEADAEYLFSDHSLAMTLSDTIYRESDQPLRERALTRCGSVLTFQPHQADIELVQKSFYPYVSNEDLTQLEPGEACVALTIDGTRSNPFFATALPLPDRLNISLQDIFVHSRQKYTTPRQKVDQDFKRPDDDEDKKKGPGQFNDAFRNIFNKRQAAAAATMSGGKPADPNQPPKEDTSAPPSPQAMEDKAEPGAAPAPAPAVPAQAEAKVEKREIPEADLRKLLYVGPIPA